MEEGFIEEGSAKSPTQASIQGQCPKPKNNGVG